MYRSYTEPRHPSFFHGALPPGVKLLLIINVAVFLLQMITASMSPTGMDILSVYFGITPEFWSSLRIYQVFTYMWLHSTTFFSHIIFNMLVLWMFGRELEMEWGTGPFLQYYIASGVGAGLVIAVLDLFFGSRFTMTIGASGALYGLLLASAMLWPNREIYLYFLFPIKMKYFVVGIGIISLLGLLGGQGGISHSGHLGGLLAGYLYLRYKGLTASFLFDRSHAKNVRIFRPRRQRPGRQVANVHPLQRLRKGETPVNWADRESVERRVDQLLDKISAEGFHSLTAEERHFLNEASRHLDS